MVIRFPNWRCGGVYDAFVLKYYGESATLVELASFTATPFENGIRLEWTTASELNAAGFHLLRSPTGLGFHGVKVQWDISPCSRFFSR